MSLVIDFQRSLILQTQILLKTVIPQSRCGNQGEFENLKAALGDLLFASN